MANELRTTFANVYQNGVVRDTNVSQVFNVDQNAPGIFENLWMLGTTEETLAVTDIPTLGYAYFRNTDPNNFVNIGVSTGVYFMRLKPDEFAWLRLEPGSTIYGVADMSVCNVWVKIFND